MTPTTTTTTTTVTTVTTTAPGAKTVNLAGSWDKVWSSVTSTSGYSKLQWALTVAGLVLVLSAVLRYFWHRHKGQGQGQHVFWAVVVGAVLVLPGVMIPVILTLVDAVINAIAKVAGG
jgi:hypothetical protein